jgi:o-succinylbenzoate synthase
LIDRVSAWWLKLPLKEPYENALGALPDFDAIVLCLRDSAGRAGYGEACPVAGYSPECPAEAWNFARDAAAELCGQPLVDVLAYARRHQARFPFVASAIAEAWSCLMDDPLVAPAKEPLRVELAGTVNSLSTEDACRRAIALCDAGYHVLKVKVGYEPMADAERVNAIARATAGRARLRVDANQGYDEASARHFAAGVHRDAIECFEQPVHAGAWRELGRIAAASPVPLMLDESIYGTEDIRRAANEVGAKAVKLKMSKAGGPSALREQVALARELELDVVIGNGVASDLGCLHEALCFARLGLDKPAEMNGFLKLRTRLLPAALTFEPPYLRLQPGQSDRPLDDSLEKLTLDRV